MDLSIIERVFALREEMDKAQLGLDAPELAELERENDPERFKRLEHPRDEQMAAAFVARAIELDAESEKWHEAARAPESRSRREIVDLLAAASAPLPVFEDADLASAAVPAPSQPTEPVVTRPPVRPPVREPVREREPIRDAERRDAHTPAKPKRKTTKSRRKTAKKKPGKPKKPE